MLASLCLLTLAFPRLHASEPVPAQAGGWRSSLYPENWNVDPTKRFESDAFLQDYTTAGAFRSEKPLPNVQGPIFKVTDFGADPTGAKDSSTAIQSAINAAEKAGGGVVFVPKGVYSVSVPAEKKEALLISKSNIVLRGEGANLSKIYNTTTEMRQKTVLRIEGPNQPNWGKAKGNPIPLTQDILGPTSTLNLQSASNLKVGDWVLVRMTVTPDWVNEHHEPDWLGVESKLGGIAYFRQVTKVSENTISVDAPIRYSLKTRDSARVVPVEDMVHEVGVEALSFGNLDRDGADGWKEEDYSKEGNNSWHTHSSSLISITRVRDSWLKNVESFAPPGSKTGAHMLSNGVLANRCRGLTYLNCRFGKPQFGGGGGNGYMYRLSEVNESLVKDCVASFSRHGFVFSGMACSGNVIFQCLDEDGGLQVGGGGRTKTSGFGSDHHMHFSHANLIDSCTSRNSGFYAHYRPYGSPPNHNITATHSVYWNTRGEGTGGPVVTTAQAHYGYVIGTSGTRTKVETKSMGQKQTDPVDIVQGEGKGQSLIPQSLYLDQLKRAGRR